MLAFLSFLPSFPNLSFPPLLPSFPLPFPTFPFLSLPFLTFPFLSYLIQFLSILTFSATVPTGTYRSYSVHLILPYTTPAAAAAARTMGNRSLHASETKKKKKKTNKQTKTKTKRFRIVMIMKRVSIRMHPMVFIIVHSGALGGQKAPEVVVKNYLTTTFFASEIM